MGPLTLFWPPRFIGKAIDQQVNNQKLLSKRKTSFRFATMAGDPPETTNSDKSGWASIASLNISKRKKTNTLEIRLENDTGFGCSLNTEEIERLLRRLRINSNQFSMVQACPERKNVIYITFAPGVDINKYVVNQSESFVLKEGIRTTTIRPVGNREVSVTVFGLHPDTRDEAVIEYLNAHGKVNKKDPIVY